MALLAGSGCGSCGSHHEEEAQPLSVSPTSIGTLSLTEKAVEKTKGFMRDMPGAAGKQLRIAVRAGGCSGYSYDFVFDSKRDGDLEIPAKDIIILVDRMSMTLLKGSTIDFTETLQGAGFVVNNPNASGGCGCGSSFSA